MQYYVLEILLSVAGQLQYLYLSEIQVKIVAVTGVRLDAGRVEFVTNTASTKTRVQPVIRVVMSNGPLVAELHGTYTLKFNTLCPHCQ